MLTLDATRRPNINEILQTPFVKARISKFLNATLVQNEFSHTIIHGRPQPGKLVPEISNSALPRPAFPDAGACTAAVGTFPWRSKE